MKMCTILGKALFVVAASGGSTLALAQSFVSAPPEAGANDAAGLQRSLGESQEIVVTATRQEQVLRRVPLAVTAYSQEALDQKGVRSVDDVARLTPGVSLDRQARYNGSQSNITIRGIRSTSGVATTGIYIDDTPVQARQGTSQAATNPYPRLFDLQRVEVLRGPQGTLFGAGSVGGAVRFITPSPNLSGGIDIYARGELGFTDGGAPSYEMGLALGTPLVEDKVGLRVSGYYRRDGGYVDRVDYSGNMVDKNANREEAVVLRAAMALRPTETLTLTPSFLYQRTKTADASAYVEAISNPDRHDFRQNNPLGQPGSDRFLLPALKAEWEIGSVTLISNTSYLDRKVLNNYDTTTLDIASAARVYGPPPAALQGLADRSVANFFTKQFTQEVRLQNNDPDARLNWVLGGFYQRARSHDVFMVDGQNLLQMVNYGRATSVPPLAPCATVAQCFFGVSLYQGQYSLFLDTDQIDKQLAAFAQVDFKITPKLKLTAGARYADLKFNYANFRAGTTIVSPGVSTTSNQGSHPFTPKFGVSWQADPNNLFYGNVAKGFRIGGVANPVGQRCAADATAIGFDPNSPRNISSDTVWSYEAGMKNRLFGGKLNVDASVYKIDWKNIQTILTLPSCQVPTTVNLGDAVSKGFDLAVTASPYQGLSLGASVAYNDSHYTTTSDSSIPGRPIRRAGEPLGGPPWSFYFNGEYEFEVGDARPYLRGDLAYTSHDDTPLDLSSPIVNPDIPRIPAVTVLNLRVGVRVKGADISLFALNALNAHPELARYEDAPAANYFRGVTLRPRTVGITATFRN